MQQQPNSVAEKLLSLSREVLKLSRNTLIINLRFMDSAISRLGWVPYQGSLAVDGRNIYYDPVYILNLYAAEKERSARAYLHMIMHCVFRHFIVSPAIDHAKWDLACDIAVEAVIIELGISSIRTIAEGQMTREIDLIRPQAGKITAEKIYHYLNSGSVSDARIAQLSELFRTDDHSNWYSTESADGSGGGSDSQSDGNGSQPGGNDPQPGGNDPQPGGNGSQPGNDESDDTSSSSSFSGKSIEEDWKDVSERMQLDLESFSKQKGDQAGNLVQNLREVNREKYDYTAFLKKFSVMGEAMKINDDEFDYIFYTYGMRIFPEKRMPLIEPLEYKDVKRIREFVIAIDTSGSVQGPAVQAFLQKTYNILKNADSFFGRVNIHIIQCDTCIQEDVKITNQEEFDHYIARMQIKGLGGTDFRPVFAHVDQLIHEHEFTNLKGLIYFTDGYGTFPERMPKYKTAFVFVNDGTQPPKVPVWAMKLILEPEELAKM